MWPSDGFWIGLFGGASFGIGCGIIFGIITIKEKIEDWRENRRRQR